MSLYLLDTDTLSLFQRRHPTVLSHLSVRPAADVAISVITIQEQMKGALAAINRARTRQQLASYYDWFVHSVLPSWHAFTVLPFPEPAILRFENLKSLRLNIGPMDLRIAAIALENGLTVITRNRRDFGRVPGLTMDDWSI